MRRFSSAAVSVVFLLAAAWFRESVTETAKPEADTIAARAPVAQAAAGPAAAQADKPQPLADEVVHRPGRIPDRVVLTWQGDPARTQAVTWRTDTSVAKALAQIAPADGSPKFPGAAVDVPATTALLATDLGPAHYHTVSFTDLKPATRYAYRVGEGANWSEWFQFRTASLAAEPFSFIYFGDAQNNLRSMWSRVIREAWSDGPRARFMIHAGDLINRAERDADWGEWFQAGGWLNGMIPSVPTPGNHEYVTDKQKLLPPRLSHHWRTLFALPENGPAGFEETAYYFDYQGVRIISLNSNVGRDRQTGWLEKTLADNPGRWTVVTFHHPVYSAAKKRDNPDLRALWKPIFDKHRVDLVLNGHDHSYVRTSLDVPDNVAEGINQVSPEGGTVYVVSISGPKMYEAQKQRSYVKRVAEDTQLYQIIHIDGGTLRYESRTAVGELYDAFTLKKREGRRNELIEQVPDTPERLRPPMEEKKAALAK
jgi:3',5'-cyclic AMP phosphodiesterase CpdA